MKAIWHFLATRIDSSTVEMLGIKVRGLAAILISILLVICTSVLSQ